VALTLPRATLFTPTGPKEWTSALVPRYQRRMREENEAVVATYLAGGTTRRLRVALGPLLKQAPLSRIVATLRSSLEAWQARSLTQLGVVYLYLVSRLSRRPGPAGPIGVRASRAKRSMGRSWVVPWTRRSATVALHSSSQSLSPSQEPKRRPARALPLRYLTARTGRT
jgi:hypothetical protein